MADLIQTTAHKRNKAQVERDRALTAKLYLQSYTQAEIAARIGVCQQQICSDLSVIRKRWLKEQVDDYDEAIATEVAKVDALESVYARAWEDSKESSLAIDEDGSIVESKTRGDPRYLSGIERCIEKRCRLLGLDSSNGRTGGSGFGSGTTPVGVGLPGGGLSALLERVSAERSAAIEAKRQAKKEVEIEDGEFEEVIDVRPNVDN